MIRYGTTEDATGLNTGIRLGEVLLETRFAGRPEPSEMCAVATLVGTALEIESGDHEDVAPFEMRMLEPRRTLIEKGSALHHLASTWTEEDPPTDARFGRHYYDFYQLLGHQRTVAGLADREEFRFIVEDLARISANHFGAVTPRPEEGFGGERGLPTRTRQFAARLARGGLPRVAGPVSRAAQPPTFGRILAQIEEDAALL